MNKEILELTRLLKIAKEKARIEKFKKLRPASISITMTEYKIIRLYAEKQGYTIPQAVRAIIAEGIKSKRL